MNRRRLMTGVHLKGRVVLIDDFPAEADRNTAFWWTPNNPNTVITHSYDCNDYLNDVLNNESARIYIPIDAEGNFDYYYDQYVYSMRAAFAHNVNIKELYFEEVEGINHISNFDMMFANTAGLQVLDFDVFAKYNFNSIYGLFWNLPDLKHIDLTPFDLTNFNLGNCSWNNKVFSSLYKLEYLNLGNLLNKGITNLQYQFQSMGRDNDTNVIIDNLFNKSLATINDNYWWQQAFSNINMDIIDFRNMDFTPLNNLEHGLRIDYGFGKTTCREIHFPDTPFRIIQEYYCFGNGNANGNLQYVNFGGGVFRKDPSVNITGERLYYMFVYLPGFNKIRCVQDTKDLIIKRTVEDNAPTWLPAKFITDDSLWEIVEIT